MVISSFAEEGMGSFEKVELCNIHQEMKRMVCSVELNRESTIEERMRWYRGCVC